LFLQPIVKHSANLRIPPLHGELKECTQIKKREGK
jgi:hypothetical protein